MIVFDNLGIDIGYVLLGAVGVIFINLILLIVIMVKQRKLNRKYKDFMLGEDGKSLEKLVQKRFTEVDDIKEQMFRVNNQLIEINDFILNTYKKMAIVKYDAFREMGGNMSFVLALLTEKNDGFVLNTMHSSREGCYTYVKTIQNGQCDVLLSEEEKEALETAMKK
ncbi:MAG: hypothetical protein PWP24_370 [Clostridiales bacterium]|nr:hypothetical protein [Clostridiales bacterium]